MERVKELAQYVERWTSNPFARSLRVSIVQLPAVGESYPRIGSALSKIWVAMTITSTIDIQIISCNKKNKPKDRNP